MAVRPSWEGHLRLSLVTCPVALYPATSEAETVRFNYINPQTNNRIRMKTVDAGTGEELSRRLTLSSEVTEGVLQVVAQAASCDTDAENPACHLTRQDWGVPVRIAADGVRRLPLVLRGLDAD